MSPTGDSYGGLERDEADIQQGYVIPLEHPQARPRMVNNGESHDHASETSEPATDDPDFRFTPIIEANEDYKKVLEVIDQLRVLDVEHEFSLPQLVVCGEQSAGKSSVLEAISGIPFPRKGSQCTRFVTQ
jgi:hypothetical protein